METLTALEELKKENSGLINAIKGALAALTQHKNYPADIEAAKQFLRYALDFSIKNNQK